MYRRVEIIPQPYRNDDSIIRYHQVSVITETLILLGFVERTIIRRTVPAKFESRRSCFEKTLQHQWLQGFNVP